MPKQYGKERLPRVDAGGSIELIGTYVEGGIRAGGSVTAIQARAVTLRAGGRVNLQEALIEASLSAGGSLRALHCGRLGAILIGGSLFCEGCPSILSIAAGGSLTLRQSVVAGAITSGGELLAQGCDGLGVIEAGGRVTLERCLKIGSLSSRGFVTLRNSHLLGDLYCKQGVHLSHSTVEQRITCVANHLVFSDSSIGAIDMRAPLNLLNFLLRGFTKHSPKGPSQVIELRNTKVGEIHFESGQGEVLLTGSSEVTGAVTGGKIREMSTLAPLS